MKEINEELGEMICDKCKGSGSELVTKSIGNTWYNPCPKCRGRGKVDWVENILGVKPPKLRGLTAIFTCTDENVFFENEVEQSVIDSMAKQIAKDLDDEILRSLKDNSEQNTKLVHRWERSNDNRVFSKLMFHTTAKSKVKSKENKSFIQRHRRSS